MDWSRIEKELNLHTMSLSQDRPATMSSIPSHDHRYSLTNSMPTWYRERPYLRQSYQDNLDESVTRGQIKLLMQEFSDILRWMRDSDKRIDNVDSVMMMLSQNIEEMSKSYEDIVVTCRNVLQEGKLAAKAIQSLQKERSVGLNQVESLLNRVSELEDLLKQQEKEFTSKTYLNQLLDGVTNQVKSLNGKLSSLSGTSSQQMDKLSQHLQRVEAKCNEDSLLLLRLDTDSRRARDQTANEVKAARDTISIYSADMKNIRDIQQTFKIQIDSLMSSYKQTQSFQHQLASQQLQIEQQSTLIQSLIQKNEAIESKLLNMESVTADLHNNIMKEIKQELILHTTSSNDRSTKIEDTVANVSKMLESTSKSFYSFKHENAISFEQLTDSINLAKRAFDDEKAYSRENLSTIHDQIDDLMKQMNDQSQLLSKDIQTKLSALESKHDSHAEENQRAIEALHEKLALVKEALDQINEHDIRDLDTKVADNIASVDHLNGIVDSMSMNIGLYQQLLDDLKRCTFNDQTAIKKDHDILKSQLFSLQNEMKEYNQNFAGKVDQELHEHKVNIETLQTSLSRIESISSKQRQALQEELLHVSEILQAKDADLNRRAEEDNENNEYRDRMLQQSLSLLSELEMKVLVLQEQSLNAEVTLSGLPEHRSAHDKDTIESSMDRNMHASSLLNQYNQFLSIYDDSINPNSSTASPSMNKTRIKALADTWHRSQNKNDRIEKNDLKDVVSMDSAFRNNDTTAATYKHQSIQETETVSAVESDNEVMNMRNAETHAPISTSGGKSKSASVPHAADSNCSLDRVAEVDAGSDRIPQEIAPAFMSEIFITHDSQTANVDEFQRNQYHVDTEDYAHYSSYNTEDHNDNIDDFDDEEVNDDECDGDSEKPKNNDLSADLDRDLDGSPDQGSDDEYVDEEDEEEGDEEDEEADDDEYEEEYNNYINQYVPSSTELIKLSISNSNSASKTQFGPQEGPFQTVSTNLARGSFLSGSPHSPKQLQPIVMTQKQRHILPKSPLHIEVSLSMNNSPRHSTDGSSPNISQANNLRGRVESNRVTYSNEIDNSFDNSNGSPPSNRSSNRLGSFSASDESPVVRTNKTMSRIIQDTVLSARENNVFSLADRRLDNGSGTLNAPTTRFSDRRKISVTESDDDRSDVSDEITTFRNTTQMNSSSNEAETVLYTPSTSVSEMSVSCRFCLLRFSKTKIAQHMRSCEFRTETCRFGCGAKIMISKMTEHESKCPTKPKIDLDDDFDED